MKKQQVDYLQKLGLPREEARIFLTLVEHGPQTMLEISRNTKIERTGLYRLTQEMLEKGWVEKVGAYKKTVIKAVDFHALEKFVDDKRQEVESLVSGLGSFTQSLELLTNQSRSSKTLYFDGVRGLKQMLWNELQAPSSIAFLRHIFQKAVGQRFLEEYAREVREKRISLKELWHEDFERQLQGPTYAKVDLGSLYERRTVDTATFEIAHNISIYDDVVAIYYWDPNEMYGVELHNSEIAKMQKSLFEFLWRQTPKR